MSRGLLETVCDRAVKPGDEVGSTHRVPCLPWELQCVSLCVSADAVVDGGTTSSWSCLHLNIHHVLACDGQRLHTVAHLCCPCMAHPCADLSYLCCRQSVQIEVDLFCFKEMLKIKSGKLVENECCISGVLCFVLFFCWSLMGWMN